MPQALLINRHRRNMGSSPSQGKAYHLQSGLGEAASTKTPVTEESHRFDLLEGYKGAPGK